MAAWRFLTVPQKEGSEIKRKYGGRAKGWGSLKVSVCIGNTQWNTSIFPDKKSGSYILPLKAKIRKAEEIVDDAIVSYILKLR
jgi:hypothetical protein